MSDPDEVWHFHVAAGAEGSGAVYVGMRAPDNSVTALVNAFVAREIDFGDSAHENWLWSDNVVDQARPGAAGTQPGRSRRGPLPRPLQRRTERLALLLRAGYPHGVVRPGLGRPVRFHGRVRILQCDRDASRPQVPDRL